MTRPKHSVPHSSASASRPPAHCIHSRSINSTSQQYGCSKRADHSTQSTYYYIPYSCMESQPSPPRGCPAYLLSTSEPPEND